ncbi:MAG: cyclic nucleotide-binding domain-containing protein [Anaerolineae bacterium]|nr:cyclic nucleotide-binding domain-containing protein [Anaerolineae bacterium]
MTTTIELFRHATNVEKIAAGNTIFEEGQTAACMYVVQHGEVEIWVKGKLLETLGEGAAFGEMSLIEDAPRSATVIAKTDCAIVPIDRKRFEFLVQQTPHFALTIMQIMSERLRKLHTLALE